MSPRVLVPLFTALLLAAGCSDEPRAAGDVVVKGGAPIRAPSPAPRAEPVLAPPVVEEPAPVEFAAAQPEAAPEPESPEPESPAPASAPIAEAPLPATGVAAPGPEPETPAEPEPVVATPAPEPAVPQRFDVEKATEILTDISRDGDFPMDGISVIDRKPLGPVPKGVEYVSWQDLSLRELYGRRLRAILSPEDLGQDEAAEFPERILAFDGKKMALLGFMVPLEWDGDDVPEFMLVRDLMSCCFGGVPMPDEWMHVRMVGKAKAEYFAYVPVLVTGTLRVGGFKDEIGYTVGCYQLEAVSLEEEAGW